MTAFTMDMTLVEEACNYYTKYVSSLYSFMYDTNLCRAQLYQDVRRKIPHGPTQEQQAQTR